MVGGVPQSDLSTNITTATQSAPELANNPGAAVAVASGGGNVPLKAQAVAGAGKRQANATAQDMVKQTGGLFSQLGHDIGSALGKVAHYANDPLSTVQHEYRYLHDVEARHGLTAAVIEGAGLLGGAAIGTVIDPGEGTVLGAEAAGWIEGQVSYKDSWSRAANPNYRDPHTGQLVSFGRDVSSVFNLHGGEKTAVSGALDGLGDMIADPLANVGKGLAGAHSLEGMGGLAGTRFQGLKITAENVDQAYQTLPSVRRAFQDIAISTPGDIVRKYPQFQGIAGELGDAHTADEVAQKFRELADASDMMDAQKLPTIALTRQAIRPLRDMARNAGAGPISQLPGVGDFISNHIANNVLLGPRRWADRLEALPGGTFDPKTMDFSGSQLNPANTRGAGDIYRMMRYAATDREARAVVDAYTYATPAQRITIVKNSIFKTLFAMAHVAVPDEDVEMEDYLSELVDGRTKNALLERLNNHLGAANIEGADPATVYVTRVDGKVVRPVLDEEGVKIQGAVRANQTGNISIPNIVEARRMAQAIRSARISRVLAGTDDFLYDSVTQGFFKPMVLMSGGYGLHISLAEMIPNALRHGVTATVGGLYNRAIANLGYKASDEEAHGLLGWLYDVAGERALRNNQDAQYLTEVYIANEGYKATVGVSASANVQGEMQPVERALGGFRQRMAMSTMESGEFSTFGNEEPRFVRMWQASLREAAHCKWTRTAAKSYLDAIIKHPGISELDTTEIARQAVAKELWAEPQDVLDNYVRSMYKTDTAPPEWEPIDDWAQAITDGMKGDVHARGPGDGGAGVLHTDLIQSVINGHVPNIEDLKAIDPSERPLEVKGRTVIPDGSGLPQRIANIGFRKILNPMVNILSRNQEFAVEYVQARRVLQDAVDRGIMTDDEAMIRAESQATTHTMRFVHNLHDRTQWTTTMRNWAPFYFAQEQAYRRMGRLLAEDPGAFRRYQMMIAGVAHLSANMQDGNGNQYIAFPGSGFIGKGVADMMGLHGIMVGGVTPAAFGGSLSSANVIFPLSQGFKPDLGPVGIVPAQTLSTMFPELGKKYPSFAPITNVAAGSLDYLTGNSGSQSQPIWEQLIPNAFVQRMLQAYNGDDRSFNSSVMQAYQYLDYQQAQAVTKWQKGGEKGPMPNIVPAQTAPAPQRQAFIDKIRNYVRWLYVARAITGMVSPVSSEVEIQNFGFPQKLNDEITKAGSVNGGMSNFLTKYPDAVPWTVAQSIVPSNVDATQTAGISLSSSVPAEQWITANQAVLDKYGVSALWLMPQLSNAKYSPTVYNEQIAQGLRVKDTPQQFLNQLYIAAGDNLYYEGLTVHENALAAAGNDSAAKNEEYNAWDAWVKQVGAQYPIWYENFQSGTQAANTRDAITTLTKVFNDNAAPAGEQTDLVKALLEQYQTAAAAYSQAGNQSSYSTQLSDQSKVNDSWIQYLDTLETQVPALKPIIQSVFKSALKAQA
jgi:hypothetical protein